MKRIVFIMVLAMGPNEYYGQTGRGISPSGVLDGFYIQEHIPTKRVIAYIPEREADIMWSKRIWRRIDLQQKMNFPLYYPTEPINDRRSLWDVIKYGVEVEGSITPYEIIPSVESDFNSSADFDGQFLFPITPPNGNITDPKYTQAINELFYKEQIVEMWDDSLDQPATDAFGNILYDTSLVKISSKDVASYLIKEDWFFDKQRSVKDVRIVGICPEIKTYDTDGNFKGIKQAFWIYFPECRYVFQNYFVYNRQNDAQRMSFDDLFWKRMFSGYICKESNVYDREIEDYENNGVKALLNANNIKQQMTKIEHDLWNL